MNIATILVTMTDGTTAEFVPKASVPTHVEHVAAGESVEIIADEPAPAAPATDAPAA